MGSILLELLPLIVGAAIIPAWIILILVMLTSEGGVARATAFVTGATLVRLAQGLLFGVVLAADETLEQDAAPIAATLILVLGILLLTKAIRSLKKEPDPDAPPPAWLTSIGSLTPLTAFGTGALLTLVGFKHWAFTLSAIGTISDAQPGLGAAVGLFLIFIVGAQILQILPILLQALFPRQSAGPLQALRGWLERNTRVILIVVSLIFGVLFVWKGVSGLTG